jgi:hypothetical protein
MITLPIPAGISDSNTAGWQSGEANALTTELTKGVAYTCISGGTPEQDWRSGLLEQSLEYVKSGEASAGIRGMFTNAALQTGGKLCIKNTGCSYKSTT